MEPPYVREIPAIVGFWLGLGGAVAFFVVCVKKGLRRAASPYLLVLIGIGVLGGVAEELMVMDSPKASFPLGFFEIAPLSWIIAGIIASNLPLPSPKQG